MPRTLVALLLTGLAALAACPSSPGPPVAERRTTPAPAARPVWDRLQDPAWEVRRDAVKALAADPSERALAALVSALQDARPEVRDAAAPELVKRGSAAAVALVGALGASSDRGAQERVIAVLVQLGAAALPVLRQAVERPQPGVRRLAVEVLARLPGPAALEPLLVALADTNGDVRSAALAALRGRKDAASVDRMIAELRVSWFGQLHALLGVLHDHGDPRVTEVVLEKFGSTSNTFSLHELLSMLVARDGGWYGKVAAGLTHARPQVRAGVLRALRYDALSLERIQSAARIESDAALGAWAGAERARLATALREAAPKQALRKLLAAPDPETRYAAAQLLAATGEKVDRAKAERELVQALERHAAALARPSKPPPPWVTASLVILYSQIAEVLWKQSCRVSEVHGLCLLVVTEKAVKVTGPEPPVRTLRYLPRDPGLVKRAKGYYDKALAVWQDGKVLDRVPASAPDRARLVARTRHYAAWAHFMLGEILLHDTLRPDVPPKLELDRKTGALKPGALPAAEAWVKRKQAGLTAAIAQYEKALNRVRAAIGGRARRSTFWGVAALARAGQVWEQLAAQVGRLAPPPLRPEEQKTFETWRSGLVRTFQGNASAEYLQCLKSSDRLLRYWEWGLVCEAGLTRTDPQKHAAWHQGNPFQGFRAPHPAPGR